MFKVNNMKTRLLLLALSLCFVGLNNASAATHYSTEQYQQTFQTNNIAQQKKAIQSLYLSGINNPAIFDIISSKITSRLQQTGDKYQIDDTAWLIKALGYSGNEKYRQQLTDITEGDAPRKIRRYAEAALTDLNQFAIWNPILNDKAHYNAQLSQADNILANALRSDILELKRQAAKRIYNDGVYQPQLLALLNQQLLKPTQLGNNKLAIDTYAWMAKALGSASKPEYKATLQQITQGDAPKKLRKYVSKYLKQYY